MRRGKRLVRSLPSAEIHAVKAMVTVGLNRDRIESPQPILFFLSFNNLPAIRSRAALFSKLLRTT